MFLRGPPVLQTESLTFESLEADLAGGGGAVVCNDLLHPGQLGGDVVVHSRPPPALTRVADDTIQRPGGVFVLTHQRSSHVKLKQQEVCVFSECVFMCKYYVMFSSLCYSPSRDGYKRVQHRT